MTRAELEARVDDLARAHEGGAFVDAVRALSAQLDADGRAVLVDVLLVRAADGSGFETLAQVRERRRTWFRRLAGRPGGSQRRRP